MKKMGLYIHIPFCKKKCKYCDFISFENTEFVQDYIKALIRNINDIEKILEVNSIGKISEDLIVDTIYFGGGTPSYIDSKYILKILDCLREKFVIEENAEITVEVNPGTTDKYKLKDYYNSGINRLSIGLQAIQDRILKAIGRIHNFEDFKNTYEMARSVGFKNINVDLMLALPNQSLDDLMESVNEIIKINPEHISLYSLILEEYTVLKKEVQNGYLKLPSEDLERKMYHETKKKLEENGYFQYEISNFSKKNFESKHNVNCWKQHEYLGFGLASHSYFNKVRFSNEKNLAKYIEIFGEQVYNKSVEVHEIQTKEQQMKEYMMLNLRKLDGVNFKEFNQKFEIDGQQYFEKEISKLLNQGLIKLDYEKIFLTKKGLDFANLVFEEFV